jgi:uncharacterized protein (DUF433 family)
MTDAQRAELNEIVWADPGRMSGAVCFRGTRVPVQTLLDHFESGSTIDEFLEGFPSVSRGQAIRFLEIAKAIAVAEIECVSS